MAHGDIPQGFLRYLGQERDAHLRAIQQLKQAREWPLSTARAYEAITDGMKHANEMCMLDQDIRRWFEAIDDSSKSISGDSTINYSKLILANLTESALQRTPAADRICRVFAIPRDLFGREDRHSSSKAWSVLKGIWREEAGIREERSRRGHPVFRAFGTRYLVIDEASSRDVQQKIIVSQIENYKDLVIFDQEVCFEEDIIYSTLHSTRLTRSRILMDPMEVKKRQSFFDELWQLAKGEPELPGGRAESDHEERK